MRNTYIYCTGKCNLGDKFTLINAREALSIVKSNLVIIVDNDNRVDNYELFMLCTLLWEVGCQKYITLMRIMCVM
ncbi:MAG: hypothetical protein IJ958_00150 [Agathobacter sp.]|nr:hypothetical protein [Agathobacter sp.]